jgi:hypothetical protein
LSSAPELGNQPVSSSSANNNSSALATTVVPGSDTGMNQEDKEMHNWWKSKGKVELVENSDSMMLVIPKPPKLADFQPTRLQSPFFRATRLAESSFLTAVITALVAFVLIPLNAIHLYSGQFFFIMVATGVSISVTLFIIKGLEQFAKKHCRVRDKENAAMNLANRKYNILATQTG